MPRGAAEEELLERVGEVAHLDLVVFSFGCQQRRLVGEVREIGADHPGRARRELVEVDVVGERHRARVDLEDLGAPAAIGRLHGDAAIEAPRAQQRRVEDVGPVGRGEHDDGLSRFEAVELGEDLVERLLALVVGTA